MGRNPAPVPASVAPMLTMINVALRRRLTVAAPMLAGCLVLAGCGGSSAGTSGKETTAAHARISTTLSSTTTSTTLSSTSTRAKPISKPVASSATALDTSLTKLMARNQPYFKNVRVSCPNAKLHVTCRFTATGGLPPIKANQRVAGTLTVTDAKGKALQYELNYAPVH